MNYPVLYCEEYSERELMEAHSRGYKEDMYVSFNKFLYKICVYDITRLTQDFELELEKYGFYNVMPNLIIVAEVTPKCVNNTIYELSERDYFDSLKPIDIDVSKLNLFV